MYLYAPTDKRTSRSDPLARSIYIHHGHGGGAFVDGNHFQYIIYHPPFRPSLRDPSPHLSRSNENIIYTEIPGYKLTSATMHCLRIVDLPQLWSLLLLLLSFPILPSASPILNSPVEDHSRYRSLQVRATIADVPSVDDIRAKIGSHGRVGTDVSLFYTGLQGGTAIQKITAWYSCNAQPIHQKAGVAWDGILPNDYLTDVGQQLITSISLVDKFQKRVCQAFAAQSKGVVYVFYPDGKGDPIDICKTSGQGLNPPNGFSAWCGQEFPALMRNPDIDGIYQVDPNTDKKTGNLIWVRGDGELLPIRDEQIN